MIGDIIWSIRLVPVVSTPWFISKLRLLFAASIPAFAQLAFLVVALGSLRILYKLGYEQLMDKPAAV